MRPLCNSIYAEYGETAYYWKAVFAKAFWKLNDKTAAIVNAFFNTCDELRDRHLISIHLRRGDKVTEHPTVTPLEVYANRCHDLIQQLKQSKNIENFAIFFFSDDQLATTELMDLFTSSCPKCFLFNMSFVYTHLLKQLNQTSTMLKYPLLEDTETVEWLRVFAQVQHLGYKHTSTLQWDRKRKLGEARDIILTITLASISEQFIGTFSSNLGRLIALLRSSYPLSSSINVENKPWDCE